MRLLNVFGIDIELHWSFLLLIAFVVLVGGAESLIVALILFTSVLLHELSHSLVAIYYKVKVKRIILLPIGGMAMIDEFAMSPKVEFRVSIAGPLFNFFVVGVFLVVNQFVTDPGALMITDTIIYANAILGLFNLLPAIPLDGGRVWRSFQHRSKSLLEATRDAVKLSKTVIALLFIISLFAAFFFGAWGFLFWNAIIFLFILVGSDMEYGAALFKTASEGLTVEDALSKNFTKLSGKESLAKVFEMVYRKKKRNLLISSKGKYYAVPLSSFSSVPKEKWASVKVSNLGTPVFKSSVTDDLLETWKKMGSSKVFISPVFKKKKLVGVITQSGLERLIYLSKMRLTSGM